MTTLTHDDTYVAPTVKNSRGLMFALLSALSFGGSGALGRGLIELGWTPGAAVFYRILVASLALSIPTALAILGRWHLLRQDARLVLAYGLVAVAGTQLFYFNAVQTMPVAMALLVEYAAPIAVVAFLWVRHGQRPSRTTVVGAVVAIVGLGLVLDLLSGASVDVAGMTWALLATCGAAVYFILSAQETHLPPLVLAGAGLWVGAVAMGLACATGVVPYATATGTVDFSVGEVPWWIVLLVLGLVTAALAYATGIAAARALGSRVASFFALMEVLFSLMFGAILLGQQPGLLQLAGGILILGGVVLVKLGEPVPELEPTIPDPV